MARKKLVSIEDAAETLSVGRRTITRFISEGQLPAYKLGSRRIVRIDAADVEALLQRIPTATPPRTVRGSR